MCKVSVQKFMVRVAGWTAEQYIGTGLRYISSPLTVLSINHGADSFTFDADCYLIVSRGQICFV